MSKVPWLRSPPLYSVSEGGGSHPRTRAKHGTDVTDNSLLVTYTHSPEEKDTMSHRAHGRCPLDQSEQPEAAEGRLCSYKRVGDLGEDVIGLLE